MRATRAVIERAMRRFAVVALPLPHAIRSYELWRSPRVRAMVRAMAGLRGYAVHLDVLQEHFGGALPPAKRANVKASLVNAFPRAMTRDLHVALDEMLAGNARDPVRAAAYARVLELYCSEHVLPNDQLSPMPFATFARLDDTFAALVSPETFRPSDLVLSGAPVPIATSDECLIGHLGHDPCMRAWESFVDAAIVSRESVLAAADISIEGIEQDAATQLVRWIEYVERNAEHALSIVAFF